MSIKKTMALTKYHGSILHGYIIVNTEILAVIRSGEEKSAIIMGTKRVQYSLYFVNMKE